LHRVDGARDVTIKFAGIGDAGEGGQIWSEIDHLLEGRDRFVVATEFNFGVADHTVGCRVKGIEGRRFVAPIEGIGEIVSC
jgi:hypothetical protein